MGNYGKNTQYYYVDPNVANATGTIDRAMSKWVNSNGTGIYTPISYRRTGNKPSSLMDFEKALTSRPNTYAWVTHWNSRTQVIPIGSRHWAWAKVEITPLYFASNETVRMRSMAHEIGHAFGLDHNPDSVRKLMFGKNHPSMPTGPVASELQGINFLYK
ncbi:hypothetical protein ACWOFR_00945 [Carnobacterium gallinarum]|uniref:hypothetical protein n=1 Tax=Carnobacterium gallinarum TaxID=2749 RepID=UPI0005548CC3|nr:hypothetical protein [Carnobacterium gallinarum]